MSPTISATDLGFYASSRFCLRCAWVRMNVKKLPYQGFPGIFSTIDRYNKLIVQCHFDRESALPVWLQGLGEVESYVRPPHWSTFKILDEASGVTLRGEADGIFKMRDGSHTIVDYKTSRFSLAQRAMLRSHETQLNAYAYIGERLGLSPIGRLALVYMEPLTGEDTVLDPALLHPSGFSMEFAAKLVDVKLRPEQLVPPLLRKVRVVAEMEGPPQRFPRCKDCAALEGLIEALGLAHLV